MADKRQMLLDMLTAGSNINPEVVKALIAKGGMPQDPATPDLQSQYNAGMGPSPIVAPWQDQYAPDSFRQSAPGPMGPGAMQDNRQPPMGTQPPQFPQVGQDPQMDPDLMPGMGADPRGMFWQDAALQGGSGQSTMMGQEGNDTLQDSGFNPVAESRTSDVAKMELGARNAMARLNEIDSVLSRNPEAFDDLTFQGQMKLGAARWKDYFNIPLSDEQRQFLTNATQTRAAVLENMNYTIKEMTGAQMGVQEADRIMATMPGPNDTPTEFRAKLARARESTLMAIARYNYWRGNGEGGAPEDVGSLANMQTILRERGASLYQQAISSGMASDQARLAAARALAKEFGI